MQAAVVVQPVVLPTESAEVDLREVSKSYERAGERLVILDKLSMQVPTGQFVALMGPSGSGKSTLLNLIAGLDRPSLGTITCSGRRIDSMTDGQLAQWRASAVGFVFQSYNLIPVLTAAENVELPLLLSRLPRAERSKRAETALRVVGLAERAKHYPRQLSGGQEQRVAIARAIVNDPQLIVADEPTGDLDRKAADDILDLLGRLNRELGKTIVMVTHDPAAAERASVVHHLEKGALR